MAESSVFAAALRMAIAERGVSLARLQTQLTEDGNPVSMATLSYWRSGARTPEGAHSLAVVEGIEDRLGLDHGHLTDLLSKAPRLGTVAPPKLPFDEERVRREAEETLTALHAAPQDALRDLSTQMVVQVGADGRVERVVTRALVQSTKGVITEIPMVDAAPSETDQLSVISDVIGARLDREYLHPGHLVSGVVFALDEPITTGQTTMIEFTESYLPGYPRKQSAWHATSRPSREALIWVRFHPDALPTWCEEYVETSGDYESRLLPTTSGGVHAVRHGFGPGVLGIRWGYDE